MDIVQNLQEQVDRRASGILSRRKVRYRLCKSLGLTSEMAGIACGWSEVRIRTLADEYQAKQEARELQLIVNLSP